MLVYYHNASVYTKIAIDALLTTININVGNCALSSGVYTKIAIDALLTTININVGNCALSSGVYTKTATDTLFATMNTYIGTRAEATDVYARLLENSNSIAAINTHITSIDLGQTFRLNKSVDENTLSIDNYAAMFLYRGVIPGSLYFQLCIILLLRLEHVLCLIILNVVIQS